MHPEYLQMTIHEREREISKRAETARLRRKLSEADGDLTETVLLRLCTIADDPMLDRLAELEGQPQPKGRYVVAEVDGAVIAAMPLAGGPAIADPFRLTSQLVPLLEVRRKQLAPEPHSAIGRLTERARAATKVQPAR